MYNKKTKIVATIGPATESEAQLRKLFEAGVNVARLNFSHGDFEEHQKRVDRIRKISKQSKLPLAILQDLCGPKIRIGDFSEERIEMIPGREFVLTTDKIVGNEKRVHVNYEKLPQELKIGSTIFLEDGRKKLTVKSIKGSDITCIIEVGGFIRGRRGVNVPGAYLSISSLTEKDKTDAQFGIKNEVDFMAISFVRRASDIIELRKILDSHGSKAKIIAKVETEEALENLTEIVEAADGIMVARGDLAIEVPAEEVPLAQKRIIKICNQAGKPVITATQMLESMIHSPVPTRAEVNDIANAIFDGSDAIMLSEETTLGEYPVQAVEVMAKVASRVEGELDHEAVLQNSHLTPKSITDSFSFAAVSRAHEIGASAIVALSKSGETARMVSRYRPHKPVIVFTPDQKTYNQLALSYGCYPVFCSQFSSLNAVVKKAKSLLVTCGLIEKGETVLIVAGIPFGESGSTNLLLAEKI